MLLAPIQASGRRLSVFAFRQNTVWRAVRSAFGASGQRSDAIKLCLMSMNNENDQANRAISTGKLHALLHVHTRPINVVVFHGPDREHSFSGWFPA